MELNDEKKSRIYFNCLKSIIASIFGKTKPMLSLFPPVAVKGKLKLTSKALGGSDATDLVLFIRRRVFGWEVRG